MGLLVALAAAGPPTRGCRSGWWPGCCVPGFPGPPAGPPRRRADGWRPCAAGRAARSRRCPPARQQLLDHAAHLALVHPVAAHAEEQGRSAGPRGEVPPAAAEPVVDGERSRHPVRHRTFLVAFAEHAQGPAVRVEVIDVQTCQFADPDARGVQQFHHGPVAQRHGLRPAAAAFRPLSSRRTCCWCSTPGRDLSRLGAFSRRAGSAAMSSSRSGPGGEGPGRGGTAGKRGAGHARPRSGAPSQRRRVPSSSSAEAPHPFAGRVAQQACDVREVGTHGVGRARPLTRQVPAETRDGRGQRRRQFLLYPPPHSPSIRPAIKEPGGAPSGPCRLHRAGRRLSLPCPAASSLRRCDSARPSSAEPAQAARTDSGPSPATPSELFDGAGGPQRKGVQQDQVLQGQAVVVLRPARLFIRQGLRRWARPARRSLRRQ